MPSFLETTDLLKTKALKKINAKNKNNVMTIKLIDVVISIGLIKLTSPMIKVELKALLPREFPIAIESCFNILARTPKASSGKEVPRATKINPKDKVLKKVLDASVPPAQTMAYELKRSNTMPAKKLKRFFKTPTAGTEARWALLTVFVKYSLSFCKRRI